jgi:hypothetical protein
MESQFEKLGQPIDYEIALDPEEDGIDEVCSTPRY